MMFTYASYYKMSTHIYDHEFLNIGCTNIVRSLHLSVSTKTVAYVKMFHINDTSLVYFR